MARRKTKICLSCQRVFRGRADARTCSERCRKRLQRAKAAVETEVEHIEHSAKEAVEGLEAKLTSHATEEGFAAGVVASAATLPVNPLPTLQPAPPSVYSPPVSESLDGSTQPIAPSMAPMPSVTPVAQADLSVPAEPAHQPGAVLAPAATTNNTPVSLSTNTVLPATPATNLTAGPLIPPVEPQVETPKQPRFQRHLLRLPAGAKFALTGAFVVVVVAIGMYLLGNQFGLNQAKSNPNGGTPTVTTKSGLSESPSVTTLEINRTTVIAGGNSFTTTGPVLFKNQINSTNAFSVQDANASGVLTVDTTNRIVGIDTTPTAGGASLQVGGSVNISGQYLVNGQPLGSSSLADFSNITRMGNTFNGPNELVELNSSGILPALNGSLLTNVDAITLQGNGANYYTNASNISSGTLSDSRLSSNVALLNANNTFTGNNILNGNNTFNGQNTFNGVTIQNGNFLFQSATNATNAFQIQNAAGNDNLLVADTINTRVGIGVQPNYTLDVNGDINVSAGNTFRIGGASICNASGCTPSSSSGSFIQNSTALQTNANFNFQSADVNGVGGIIRGASGQMADLLEGQTSTGSQVFALDPSGNVNIIGQYEINGAPICTVGGCTVASGSGSYIQNGTALQATANFNIESVGTGNVVGILKGISGQTADILQAKDGNGAVVFTVGNQGQTLHKDTSSGSHTFFQVQDSSSQALLTADTITGQILFPNADISSAALLIGGDANLYRSTNSTLKTDGNLVVAGNLTVNGTGLFRNTTDSTVAFQIQNAAGASNLLVADTSHTAIGVAMVPLANVASLQVTGGIDLATTNTVNSNTNSLVGIYNDVTNNGAGDAGMQGFYADLNNNSTGTLVWARDYEAKIRNNSTGTITDAYDFYARTPSNTGGGAITSAYGIYLQGSNTTGVTNPYGVYQAGTSDTNFFNAKTNTFKAGSNTTTTFQIQNASGVNILTADTSKGVLTQSGFGGSYIGGADASGTTNSGTGNSTFNVTFTSGKYLYAVKNGDATDCSTVGNHVGCELQIYDVTNPATPTYIGGADASGSTNSGIGNSSFLNIYVAGHYAYIGKVSNTTACSQATGSAIGCELQVYDVSNPATPTYVGGADGSGLTNSGIGGTSFSGGLYISGRYLYVSKAGNATACSQTAGSAIGCELQVYDVSNPAVPTYVGGADISGSSSGTGSDNSSGIFVSGRYAYFSAGGNATACSQTAGSAIGCELQIYDVSNPATPTYVGGADSSGSTNSGTSADRSFAPYVSGRYVYVPKTGNATACSQTVGSAIGCELQVYDVSNPAIPTYVGGVDASGSTNSGTGNNTFDSVYTYGRYAYVANSGSATACSQTVGSAIGCELQVYDVSNPAAPSYVGGADASGSTNSGTGNSAFNLVNVSGRYAYVSNSGSATACSQTVGSAIGCELQVYDVSGIDAVSINTGTLETGGLSVTGNAKFSNDISLQGGLNVGQSAFIQGDITVAGAAKFQDKTNSTTAFQIQNSGGTSILTADTTNRLITVANLQATGTITLQNGQGAGIQLRTVSNSSIGNAMTFSGNEITDVVRSVHTQGDGRQPPDSSMGIWEATTNLMPNGGGETNSNGFINNQHLTVSRTTTVSKFGTAAFQGTTTTTGTWSAEWRQTDGNTLISATAGNTYTFSMWSEAASNYGTRAATINIVWCSTTPCSGGNIISTSTVNISNLSTSWTRYSVTGTAPATTTIVRPTFTSDGSPGTGETNYFDGVQFEQKSISTPYVETSSGTVARSAASITAPASNLNATTGWFAARIRMGYSSANAAAVKTEQGNTDERIFEWVTDSNTRLAIVIPGTNAIQIYRTIGGVQTSVSTASLSWNAGDILTIVGAWDATKIYISANASSFASGAASPSAPTGATFNIGSSPLGSSGDLDSDVLWAAAGTGSLNTSSTTDVTALYNYGNSDPTLSGLTSLNSGAANPTFVWDGESTQYSGTNNAFTNDSQISIDDVNLTHTANGSISLQGGVNSTTAFQVQNASGTNELVVDTTNQRIAVGPSAVPANGVLTIGTNTTANSGGIYLGTDTNLYRSNTSALKTDGTFQVGTQLGVGAAPSSIVGFNVVQTFSSDQASGFNINVNHTTATGGTVYGYTATAVASNSTGTMNNVQSLLQSEYTGVQSAQSNVAVNSLEGFQSRVGIAGASPVGTITNGVGLILDQVANFATGTPAVTISNQKGLVVNNQGAGSGSNGLTIQSAIGIDVLAQNTASTSNIGVRIAKGNTYTLQLSDTGGTAAGGIEFGTDTDLYRSAAGTLKSDGALQVGTAAATTSQLTVLGGSGGGAIITLSRTSGAASQYSWALAGGGLSFSDDTDGFIVANMFGNANVNELYLGQKNRTVSTNRPSLLSAETYGTSAGTDVSANDLRLQGGLGTGTGTPGNIVFYTGNITVSGSQQSSVARLTIAASTGVATFAATGKTALSLSDTTTTTGLTIGGDTNLYRSTANTLKTDGNLVVAGTALFKDGTNASTAFQVQDQNGNNYIQADTSGAILSLGNIGLASTIQIGNTTGAVIQTINIGNNATGSSTTTITIGSTVGTSGVTIQSGTGRITLTGQIKVAQSGTALSGTNLAESGGGTATLGAGSTDTAGSFTTSTTSHTTITLTFGATMTNAPYCVVTSGNAAAAAIAGSSTSYYVTTTATTLVVNTAADTTAAQWVYHCFTH